MQKIKLLFILMLLSVGTLMAQEKFTISGQVKDENGQALIGANIYLDATTIGTASNNKGEFLLKNVNKGNYKLIVSFAGHRRVKQDIELNKDINNISLNLKERTDKLGEVVVTGTGTAHHLKNAPVQTEVFNQKKIENIAAPEFTSLMSNLSPSFEFSPGTMGSFMQLNGLGNDFIVVLVDGKRMYGGMAGMNDLSRINVQNIERIELVKGASSALYGSDAIAGVINIITKKSNRKIDVSSSTRYSAYNTLNQTVNASLNLGKLSSTTSFSYNKSDGWQLSPNELTRKGKIVETDAKAVNAYVNKTLYQKLEYKLSDKLSVYADAKIYDNDITNPITVKKYGYYYTDQSYSAGAKYLVNKNTHIIIDAHSDNFRYYYHYNQDQAKKNIKEDEKSINNEEQRQDVNLKWVSKLDNHHRLSLGTEYVNQIYISEHRVENGKADASTLSLFAQDEITLLKKLQIVIGARVVNHKEFGTAFTPKISALYQLGNFNLRGTYSNGFKTPTLKELYYQWEIRNKLYLGNIDLDPQKSNYYSSAIEYNNNFMSISTTVYLNQLHNLITYKEIATSPEDAANGIKITKQHYNLEEAQTTGVDFMCHFNLPYGFTLGAGYSYLDAKDITNNTWLNYTSHNHANANLTYDHSWSKYTFRATITGKGQDAKYNSYRSESRPYHLWRISTIHQFTQIGDFDLSATLGVDNIFDYVDDLPYGSYYGTLNPGRTFFVGLNIRFAK